MNATRDGTPSCTLVIGYGSDLRADDAVGRRVAETVQARGLPGVRVRSVHQLTPELAAELGAADRVVFVDATVAADEVSVGWLDATPDPQVMTHHMDPAGLLGLASLLGSSPTDAALVSVPATDLGLGTHLSPRARTALDEAVAVVVDLAEAGYAR